MEIDGKSIPKVQFVSVPPPKRFPEYQEQLTAIGGLTPDGRPRLKLEWGGEETRVFLKQKVAKYRYATKRKVVAYRAYGNPTAKMKKDRFDTIIYESDLREVHEKYPQFRKRILDQIEYIFDIPVANWFICQWISPQKACIGWKEASVHREGFQEMEVLGPEPVEGYYLPVFQFSDPEHPGLYIEPNEDGLLIVKQLMKEHEANLFMRGVHIDEPGNDYTLAEELFTIDKAFHNAAEAEQAAMVPGIYDAIGGRLKELGV